MTTWTSDELTRIGTAEELRLASLGTDDQMRGPTTMWVVRNGDDIFVRAVNGPDGVWYRGTQLRHEGHVWAGGVDKDVTFVDVPHQLAGQIDGAYRTKYQRYADNIVGTVLTPKAQAATIKLVPR